MTCEEVVNRGASGKKHGYVSEIDAMADGPVPAVPVLQAGRSEHEAADFVGGILYWTSFSTGTGRSARWSPFPRR